jgi:hypothetical protein
VFAGVTEKFAPLLLVPTIDPPMSVVYHLMELPVEVAVRFEDAPAQIAGGVAVTISGAVGETFIVRSDVLGLLIITGLLDKTLIL